MEIDNNPTLSDKINVQAGTSAQTTNYCEICKQSFKYKKNLTTHNRAKHGLFRSYFVCQYCGTSYSHKRTLTKHLKVKHTASKFYIWVKEFRSLTEFNDWKCKIEDDTHSRFVIGTSKQVNNNFCKRVFKCFRSGKYIPSGKGFRKSKKKGSYKSGHNCKARIIGKFYKTGEIKVKYFPIHNGHDNDNDDRHLFPRNKEKSHILSLLSQGFSPKDVVEKLCNLPNYKFLTTSYIYNLTRNYSLNKNMKMVRKSTQIPQVSKKFSRINKKVPCVSKEAPKIIKEVPEEHIQISHDHIQFLHDQPYNTEDYIYILQDQTQVSQYQTWIPEHQVQNTQNNTQILQYEIQIPQNEIQISQNEIQIPQNEIQFPQNEIKISQDEVEIPQDEIQISQDNIQNSQDNLQNFQDKIQISQNEIQIHQDEAQNIQNKTEITHGHTQILQDHTPIVVLKEFRSFHEFRDWKCRIEDYTMSNFVVKYTRILTTKYSKQTFFCSKNQRYELEGNSDPKVQMQKAYVPDVCEAKIVAKFYKKGGIKVKYFPTHNGHDKDEDDRNLIPRNKEKSNNLPLLSEGFTDKDVMEKLCNLPKYNFSTRTHIDNLTERNTRTNCVRMEHVRPQTLQGHADIPEHQAQNSQYKIQILKNQTEISHNQIQDIQDHIKLLRNPTQNSENFIFILQDNPQNSEDYTYILQDQTQKAEDRTPILPNLEDHTYILQEPKSCAEINELPSFSVPKNRNQLELFCCIFCKKSFFKKYNLIKHLKSNHQDTQEVTENEPVS